MVSGVGEVHCSACDRVLPSGHTFEGLGPRDFAQRDRTFGCRLTTPKDLCQVARISSPVGQERETPLSLNCDR